MDKKNEVTVEKFNDCLELDEMYWFTQRKPRTKTRENVYLMTMVSRKPRQTVGFDVAFDKSPKRIQSIVDGGPPASKYCTDGWLGYIDVIYPGHHTRNTHDKSDTFTVEGVNADLRHYIPILARRSRCFPRTLETLKAVLEVFVDAYNKFGKAKHHFRLHRPSGDLPFALVDFFRNAVRHSLNLPVLSFTTSGNAYGERDGLLKEKPHDDLDDLVVPDDYIKKFLTETSFAEHEEIQRLKHSLADQKAGLSRKLDSLCAELKNTKTKLEQVETRLEKLRLQKQLSTLERDLKKGEENLFMAGLR